MRVLLGAGGCLHAPHAVHISMPQQPTSHGCSTLPLLSPLQRKLSFAPGAYQVGMVYTCRAFASSPAGSGARSAPFSLRVAG